MEKISLDECELEIIDFNPLEDRLHDDLMDSEAGLYFAHPTYVGSDITWEFEPLIPKIYTNNVNVPTIDEFNFRLWLDNKPENYRIGILSRHSNDVYLFMSMLLEENLEVYTSAEHINEFIKLSRQLASV